ncbi:MAG: hypothetical protein V3V18_00880 [Methylococcales bacterium]
MADRLKTIQPAIIIFIATALAYAVVGARNAGIAYQYKLAWNFIPVELNALLILLLPILGIGGFLYNIDSLIYMRIAHLQHCLRFRLIVTARSILVLFALLAASYRTPVFWVFLIYGIIQILLNAYVEFLSPYFTHKDKEGYINRLQAQGHRIKKHLKT